MSLLPRALLKNYSQDALKPLEDECNAFEKIDFFSSPQAASHNVSISSNRTQLVGTVGKIPNLFGFHNVDLERLRKEKKFLALPPESWLDFTKDEQSHRLCRQGTNTWASLHKGVLTSGNILGALGFKEAHVVTKIGLHSESASHQDLMRAVMVMREDAAAVVEAPSTTGENERDEDDAREKNEAIVKAYNEELMLSVEEERNDGWYDNDSDDDDDDDEMEDLSGTITIQTTTTRWRRIYLLRVQPPRTRKTRTKKIIKKKSSFRRLKIAKVGFNITSISPRQRRWTSFARRLITHT
jgi:hypothetical protein